MLVNREKHVGQTGGRGGAQEVTWLETLPVSQAGDGSGTMCIDDSKSAKFAPKKRSFGTCRLSKSEKSVARLAGGLGKRCLCEVVEGEEGAFICPPTRRVSCARRLHTVISVLLIAKSFGGRANKETDLLWLLV